jgi:DNA-binding NtrC family response regulator
MKDGGKKRGGLERWLTATTTPVFLLGADRKVLFFNAGCERLTGWAADDVVGQSCQYASVADQALVAALTASLCPPAEVFAGQELSLPAYVTPKQGPVLARMLHFYPLRDTHERVTAVIGVVLPIQQPAPLTTISPTQQLHAELSALRGNLRTRFGEQTLVCRSDGMAKVLNQLDLARQTPVFVYLEGEAGAGKEHLARVIHYGGPQRANWFIPLECRRLAADELSRILERLFELHLTGHRGGTRPQPGTLYLADVEHLPRDLQERLAKAFGSLSERTPPNLRLMSSGTRNLKEAVAADALRPDLFALLTPLSIEIPPLRSRSDDLPLLAQHFLEELNRLGGSQVGGFSEEVWPLFKRYAWPGNLDELSIVIREAFAHATEGLIKPPDLPFRFRTALDAHELPPPPTAPPLLLDPALTRVETNLIQIALERSKYNKSKAAEMLGINRARLYRRMEQLGIEDREGPAAEGG